MKHFRLILIVFFALVESAVQADTNATSARAEASALRDHGDFKGAATVLDRALSSKGLPPSDQRELAFQRDVLQRIKHDYAWSETTLFQKLSASVKNLTRAEFDQWRADGWFDGRVIDGATVYVDTSVSNLFFRHPELTGRRIGGKDTAPEQKGRLEIARAIKQAARAQGSPYVLPHRFAVTMRVTAAAGAAPPGEMIRAWLPIPRQYPFQDGFALKSNSPSVVELSPPDSPIRSAYLEQPAALSGPTRFEVSYIYATRGVFFDLKPEKVRRAGPKDPALSQYMREAPHVVFSDRIKKLAHEIAGAETNPMLQAKANFDWVSTHIRYSFAREYSTLTNISDYCLDHGYGDCGQEALLFITLCRADGIPARWQSGWNTFPGFQDIHDWTEIWLAPYGWVPVDPWAGIFATQYGTALTPAERVELRDFYFGGLDYYRMAANSDHSQELNPPKQTMRSDDVDFQRGELEWARGNIYFDRYSYWLGVEELK